MEDARLLHVKSHLSSLVILASNSLLKGSL